ncbi:hypothetical protein Dsin_012529 [Dipteronia sinensis]|uniref:Uncharacterized protein n=1 Tax=Dipteronia sinensis TaxID=43782 RepID=A0AAE0E892_9ROSI|nr:hypothetical protein Dsin_012529 [Dipteronia sinensis]
MIEEELENSEDQKALHQEMMDSTLLENDAREGTMDTNVITASGDIEQVDIPRASNFKEVASKLKEAMEVAHGVMWSFSSLCMCMMFCTWNVRREFGFLWNGSIVKLQVVASSRHSIMAVVAEGDRFWVLTIVYANPSVVTRRMLWGYLSVIRNCLKGPRIVMGDFNEITNSVEKRGCRRYFANSGFVDWINENKLVDLGSIGQKYT